MENLFKFDEENIELDRTGLVKGLKNRPRKGNGEQKQ